MTGVIPRGDGGRLAYLVMHDMYQLPLPVRRTLVAVAPKFATLTLAGRRGPPGEFKSLFKVEKCGKRDPKLKAGPVLIMM